MGSKMPRPSSLRDAPRAVRVLGIAAVAGLVLYTLYALIRPSEPSGAGALVAYGVFPAVHGLAAAICLWRAALAGPERTAWLLFGSALIAEGSGDVAYDFVVRQMDPAPYPSIADAAWLGAYALYLGAFVTLLRARLGHLRIASWLDGSVATLAIAAVASAFISDGALHAKGATFAANALSVAYPVIDLVFLVMLATVFAVTHWRPTGVWLAIAAAIAARIVADTLFLADVPVDPWGAGALLQAGWALAALLTALGAWLPRSTAGHEADDNESYVVEAVPTIFAPVALVIVVYDHFNPLPDVAAGFAYLALVAGALRTATSYARAHRLASQKAALEQTAAILRAAGESIYTVDADGFVTYANPATERTLGYAPDELIGRRMHDAIHHTRRDGSPFLREHCPVCRTLEDGRERRVTDDVFWRKEGVSVPVDYTVTPITEDRAVTGAAIVFVDATERSRVERDENAHNAVNRALAHSGTLAEARLGLLHAIAGSMGFDVALLWATEGPGVMRCETTWDARGNGVARSGEGTELRPDSGVPSRVVESGQVTWVAGIGSHLPPELARTASEMGLLSAVYMPVKNGSTVLGVVEFLMRQGHEPDRGMLGALATIGSTVGQYSARRRAEIEADRMKDEFFALVSHELRTPLTSIIGYLDIVLEDEAIDPQTRHFLSVVERNTNRLMRLVGDLLFVAQVEGGKTSLDVGLVDLPTVAAEAVEAASPRAREGGIDLLLEASKLPPIQGDAGRIAQAIDNLVSNAIKFTPEGGQVRVAVRQAEGTALIEVSDTGMGIPAAEQQRLFDRFFRSSLATTQAIQGVGLGLSIVKAIVEGHGGSVDLESVEGKGTTFRAVLPMRPAAAGAARATQSAA
jgi:PAS domain S-box-containing protein